MRRSMMMVHFVVPLALLTGCGPSLTHVTSDSPASGVGVQVREFEVVADTSNCPLQGSGTVVAQRLVETLQSAGVNAHVVPASMPAVGIVLEGQVTQCSRGSRGLRYLAGVFSASHTGAARFGVTGRAVGSDGNVIGEFGARRRAGWGLFGGNGNTLLGNCIEAVVHDVAEMVISAKYQNRVEDTVFRANVLVHP